MKGLKESGQAVGAQAITRLADAAAPTVLDQAARLQSRQRFFNLTVTNVPGPQVPLYLMGPPASRRSIRRCRWCSTRRWGSRSCPTTGTLFFGLLGDYDALADIDALAADLDAAIAELARGAGAPVKRAARPAAGAGPRVKRVLVVARRCVVAAAAAACVLIAVLASRDSSAGGRDARAGRARARPRLGALGAGPATPASPPARPPTSGTAPRRAVDARPDRALRRSDPGGAAARQRDHHLRRPKPPARSWRCSATCRRRVRPRSWPRPGQAVILATAAGRRRRQALAWRRRLAAQARTTRGCASSPTPGSVRAPGRAG